MKHTDDIDRFAEQAGFPARRAFSDLSDLYPRLERFAALVAAAERKRIESRPWGAGTEWIARAVEAERDACAAVARQWDADHPASNYGGCIANLIEARGQA
jgi:hypothetical protein